MKFFNLTKDCLTINGELHDNRFPMRIKTSVQFFMMCDQSAAENWDILCSSSLDFPDEVTDDLDLIIMCDIIRGNNVSGRIPDDTGDLV